MKSMLLYPINHLEHSALRDRWGGRSLSFFSGTMRTGGYDDEEETRSCTDGTDIGGTNGDRTAKGECEV